MKRFKRLVSVLACAGMAAGSLSPLGSVVTKAAANEVEREDASVVYFVDAGDYVTGTVCKGDQLGTRNSVTDQVYGEDKATGFKWGIVDEVSEPLKNGSASCGGVFTDSTWPYEQNTANADAGSKTLSNRYTKNQYEDGIDVRFIDYKFEVAAGTYNIEVYTADPWSCSQSPTLLINSKDATADFNAGKGTKLTSGTAKTETVTMEADGDMTVSFRASGDANKAINVCYIKISDKSKINEEEKPEKGNARKDAAAIYFASPYVYDNISLPVSGANGSSISWTSSNESVLGSDGVVTRPEAGNSDEVVVLTASVNDGKQTITKSYEFTVLAQNSMSDINQFDLEDVVITDGYYLSAQEGDIDFLKRFDNDRILYRFRDTAGLDTKGAKTYKGWEDSLIAGHSVGHYLTAVAQAIRATNDEELKEKLADIIHGLKECQDAIGTGFIFGARVDDRNNIEKQFDIVEGKAQGDTWVPWYTMHKIIAGLVDTYKFTGNQEALDVASSLGEWVYERSSKWTKQVNSRILGTEYGGMNDCLYELYSYTKNEHHKLAAEKFDDPDLYKTICSTTKLSPRHANTTIPKFVGSIKRFEVLSEMGEATDEDYDYFEYAKQFFDIVVNEHAYITGGVSDMEHFRDACKQDDTRTQCNNESCCAYNLLKLSRELYKITGERKYADYYENTLRNAIMGAINPEDGSTTYFTPMATGYFKTFSEGDPDKNMFWCCTGSGMENFTKLGDSIYFKKDKNLFVNQYVASTVNWKEANMKITQESNVVTSDVAAFKVELMGVQSSQAAINLRVPDWIAGTPVVKVNNVPVDNAAISSGYIKVERSWSNGDVLSIQYPMEVKAFGLPDNSTVFGFKYGPTVLAAKLGTDLMDKTTWAGANLTAPHIKVVGNEQAQLNIGYNTTNKQILGTETISITEDLSINEFMESVNTYFVRDTNQQEPTFKLTGTDVDENIDGGLTFVPFNTLNTERYGIYWYFESSVEEMTPEEILAKKEEARFSRSMIDSIQPGYGQYENDAIHQLKEENSVASTSDKGGSTRHAANGGYFMYNMIVKKDKVNRILCQFAKEDNGKTIKILVGDTVIADYTLDYDGNDDLFQRYFAIPSDVAAANIKEINVTDSAGNAKTETVVPVKFMSSDSSDSARLVGGLYMTVNYSNNASIVSVTSSEGTVVADGANYKIYVPTTSIKTKYKVNIADQYGLLYINGVLVNDAKMQTGILTGDTTVINAKVYGEDHETNRDYSITIVKGEYVPSGGGGGTVTPNPPVQQQITLAQAVEAFKQTKLPSSVTVYKGSTKALQINYNDIFNQAVKAGIVSVKSVSYKSAKKKIATVSKAGKIKGVKKGKSKITAVVTLSTGDSITLQTTAKVKNPEVKITGKKTVKKGKSVTLKAKGYGIKGKVKWSVNKPKIAKITKKGKLTGLKKGKVKVTAKIKKVKKTVNIKVQ